MHGARHDRRAAGRHDPGAARPGGTETAGRAAAGQPAAAAAARRAAPQRPSEPTGLRLVCTAPADVKLINGASATLEVVTEKAANALVLPVEAVAGTQGKGKVDVVRPDRTRRDHATWCSA